MFLNSFLCFIICALCICVYAHVQKQRRYTKPAIMQSSKAGKRERERIGKKKSTETKQLHRREMETRFVNGATIDFLTMKFQKRRKNNKKFLN